MAIQFQNGKEPFDKPKSFKEKVKEFFAPKPPKFVSALPSDIPSLSEFEKKAREEGYHMRGTLGEEYKRQVLKQKPTPTPDFSGFISPEASSDFKPVYPTATPTFAPTATPTPTPAPILEYSRNPSIKENLRNSPNFKRNYEKVSESIKRAASTYNVPVNLLTDISFAESSLDPNKLGPTNDVGLFQFIPTTWRETMKRMVRPKEDFDLDRRKDPDLNALAAAFLISKGELRHWKASEYNWSKFYTEEELKKYYGF